MAKNNSPLQFFLLFITCKLVGIIKSYKNSTIIYLGKWSSHIGSPVDKEIQQIMAPADFFCEPDFQAYISQILELFPVQTLIQLINKGTRPFKALL